MAQTKSGRGGKGRRVAALPRSAHAWDIREGMTLRLATGDVHVVAAFAAHGGVECDVRAAVPKKGEPSIRILWFYPQQAVTLLSEFGAPGTTLGPRPLRGAALARSARMAAPDSSEEAA